MRRPDDQRSRERRSCVRRECARLRGRPQLAWLARPSLAIDVWSGGNTPPLRVDFLCDATGCRIIAQIEWELKEGWAVVRRSIVCECLGTCVVVRWRTRVSVGARGLTVDVRGCP